MELWIRSQNRRHLMKPSNLECGIDQGLWFINGYSVDEVDNLDLGYYATEERCLEILDEIQKLLNPQQLLVVRKDFDNEAKIELLGARQSGITLMENSKLDFYQYSSYVYEMPQE